MGTTDRAMPSRLAATLSHITASSTGAANAPRADDDVVIVSAVRTPIAKAKKGGFKDAVLSDMIAPCLEAVLSRSGVPATAVDDVSLGNCLAPGGGAMNARQAQFLAGMPETVPVQMVNRQCSSGIQAVANIAANIKAGIIDVGVAGGVESMTKTDMMAAIPPLNDNVMANEQSFACLTPMGVTSENVAEKFGITRETQDKMAAESHRRAAAAQAAGLFNEEIVPVTYKNADGKDVTVSQDEGIRAKISMEQLAKLPSVFKEGGSTTPGNASQVSDGAAAVLLMRRSKAAELGVKPLARFVTYNVCGVDPSIMGIGPAVAIPKALAAAGITKDDVGVYELNEAFASQAAYCVDNLGLDSAKVNPNGGAIALGHPLGCTGSRQVATMLPHMKRNGIKFGVVSMCIGTGMGAACVIENEQ